MEVCGPRKHFGALPIIKPSCTVKFPEPGYGPRYCQYTIKRLHCSIGNGFAHAIFGGVASLVFFSDAAIGKSKVFNCPPFHIMPVTCIWECPLLAQSGHSGYTVKEKLSGPRHHLRRVVDPRERPDAAALAKELPSNAATRFSSDFASSRTQATNSATRRDSGLRVGV